MAKHALRFLQIVNDARSRVKETTIDAVKAMLDEGERFVLIDVREESVLVSVELSWLLARFANAAAGMIRTQGTLMLEKK